MSLRIDAMTSCKGLPGHQAKVANLHSKADAERLPDELVEREKRIKGFPKSRRIPDVQIIGPVRVQRNLIMNRCEPEFR
jgi:hypothetical protein